MMNTDKRMSMPMTSQNIWAALELVGSSRKRWRWRRHVDTRLSRPWSSASAPPSQPLGRLHLSTSSESAPRAAAVFGESASAPSPHKSACCFTERRGNFPGNLRGGCNKAQSMSQNSTDLPPRLPRVRQSAVHNISSACSSVKPGAAFSKTSIFRRARVLGPVSGMEPWYMSSPMPRNSRQSSSRIRAKREVKARNLVRSSLFVLSVHSDMKASMSSGSNL
mmetsp:Transcript_103895/g.300495  ORF Transcript_103895/g.300495 Transcript_103895/m.300495 type:complete len:221 (-) Transcript_103895:691-1353(-)